jgi:hypothetical protein
LKILPQAGATAWCVECRPKAEGRKQGRNQKHRRAPMFRDCSGPTFEFYVITDQVSTIFAAD